MAGTMTVLFSAALRRFRRVQVFCNALNRRITAWQLQAMDGVHPLALLAPSPRKGVDSSRRSGPVMLPGRSRLPGWVENSGVFSLPIIQSAMGRALADGALQPIETQTVLLDSDGVRFALRTVSSIA